MPAFAPKASQLTTSNDTVDVDIVDAPAAGTIRMVTSVTVYNADTQPATLGLKIDVSSTETPLVLKQLAVGESLVYEVKHNLDSTMVMQLTLAAAVTTNQLTITATFGDWS